MRLRRVSLAAGGTSLAIWDEPRLRWLPLEPALQLTGEAYELLAPAADDPLAFLAAGEAARDAAAALSGELAERGFADAFELTPLLPFEPRLLRAFASWERHWEQAARGLVRRYLPRALPVATAYERLTRRTFPAFRPKPLFYEQPASYIGNHLTFVADGDTLPWPAYCRDLDFELEFGAVLARPVKDATAEQGQAAIGGFVVLNDLSARDTQWDEYRRGVFGPLGKTKTFASAMSAELVTADEVLPRIDRLRASVRVNGQTLSQTGTAGIQHPLGEMVAHASAGEQLHAGELFASGTLPDGCGLELDRWLSAGDLLELEIEGIATLTNRVGTRAGPAG
jgi:2-keto-4-pentenoate hydratase/2-oxohepta-3-ene-1,7-dioic acid hydratase in catechol pathway